MNDTIFVFLGSFCVSHAIARWGLHRRIALRFLMLFGGSPSSCYAGFMSATAFLSMWMSNSATAAMMVPIGVSVLKRLEANLISERQREEEEGEQPQQPQQQGGEADFLPVPVGPARSPGRNGAGAGSGEHEEGEEMHVELSEGVNSRRSVSRPAAGGGGSSSEGRGGDSTLEVPVEEDEATSSEEAIQLADSGDSGGGGGGVLNATDKAHFDTFARGLVLCIAYSSTIGGMGTLTGTGPNIFLYGVFETLYPQYADSLSYGRWLLFGVPLSWLFLLLAWRWMSFAFITPAVRSTVKRVDKGILEEQYAALGPMAYAEKVVLSTLVAMALLWFTRNPGFVPGWGSLMSERKYVSDASVSMALAVMLFVLPAHTTEEAVAAHHKGRLEAAALAAAALAAGGVAVSKPGPIGDTPVTVTTILDASCIPELKWEVVLLLGGGFALSDAFAASGLSAAVGGALAFSADAPLALAVLVIQLVTVALTSSCSDVASCSITAPLAGNLALARGVHPLLLMIPTCLSCSLAFLLPSSTPPNAIAFSTGYPTVGHLIKAGAGLIVIGIPLILLGSLTLARWVFSI